MNLISLPETKNYLRVDHCEDDKLIHDLLLTSKKLCMDVCKKMLNRLLQTTK